MNQNQMIHQVTTLSVFAGIALFTACASNNGTSVGSAGNANLGGAAGTGGAVSTGGTAAISMEGSATEGTDSANDSGTDPNCVSNDALFCAANLLGFPFVRVAIKSSDYCSYLGTTCSGVIAPAGETSVYMSQPKAGTLCLTGTVSQDGYALLALEVAEKTLDRKKILQPFDAFKRGITQLTLTIDSPPAQGVDLALNMVQKLECPARSIDCFYPPNFDFKTITTPGTITAALANFKTGDSSQVLDTSVLHSFVLQVNGAGNFNFCVHDFKFLDANNNVVSP